MKTEILNLIDERFDRNRNDFQEGWVTREEYIAVKAEILCLKDRVERMIKDADSENTLSN
jgi:hypothetical protein